MRSSLPIAAFVAAFVAVGAGGPLHAREVVYRDPAYWPFGVDSVWNTPLGDGAGS